MSFFFFSLFFCFEVEVKKKKKTQKHSHLGIRKKKLLGLLGVAAVHLIHPPLAPALLVPPVGQRQDQPEAVFGRRGHDQVEAREAVVGKDAEPGLEGAVEESEKEEGGEEELASFGDDEEEEEAELELELPEARSFSGGGP